MDNLTADRNCEELRRMLERRVTTRGVVVHDFPMQRETGVQVVVATRNVATETTMGARQTTAVQTEPLD